MQISQNAEIILSYPACLRRLALLRGRDNEASQVFRSVKRKLEDSNVNHQEFDVIVRQTDLSIPRHIRLTHQWLLAIESKNCDRIVSALQGILDSFGVSLAPTIGSISPVCEKIEYIDYGYIVSTVTIRCKIEKSERLKKAMMSINDIAEQIDKGQMLLLHREWERIDRAFEEAFIEFEGGRLIESPAALEYRDGEFSSRYWSTGLILSASISAETSPEQSAARDVSAMELGDGEIESHVCEIAGATPQYGVGTFLKIPNVITAASSYSGHCVFLGDATRDERVSRIWGLLSGYWSLLELTNHYTARRMQSFGALSRDLPSFLGSEGRGARLLLDAGATDLRPEHIASDSLDLVVAKAHWNAWATSSINDEIQLRLDRLEGQIGIQRAIKEAANQRWLKKVLELISVFAFLSVACDVMQVLLEGDSSLIPLSMRVVTLLVTLSLMLAAFIGLSLRAQ